MKTVEKKEEEEKKRKWTAGLFLMVKTKIKLKKISSWTTRAVMKLIAHFHQIKKKTQ